MYTCTPGTYPVILRLFYQHFILGFFPLLPDDRGPQKTGVLVEFSTLAFHLRSVGDLTDDERDAIVSFLHERMLAQERAELAQLQNFYDVIASVAHRNVWMCSQRADEERSQKLRESVIAYFEAEPEIDGDDVTALSFAREKGAPAVTLSSQVSGNAVVVMYIFAVSKMYE